MPQKVNDNQQLLVTLSPPLSTFVNFKASDLSDYKIPANKFKGYLGNKSLECPLATKRQLQSIVHIRSFIIYYTLSSNIIFVPLIT